jgi:hypothetical protein
MSMNSQADDLKEVAQHLDRAVEGMNNLRELPLWAQAAHSMLTYNPESVLYQVNRWQYRLREDEDTVGGICAMVIAAHRIHRFGAGPAINEEALIKMQSKVAELEHPEDLAEGLAHGALEPQYFAHAGHQRGEWPIILLPVSFYAE